MKKPGLKEPVSLIDAAIHKSLEIIILKLAMKQIKNGRTMLTLLRTRTIMSLDYCDDILKEIYYLINERERDIKFLLQPLLKGDDYEYHSKYSFSATEIKEGYAIIQKIVNRDNNGKPLHTYDNALLLSNYEKNNIVSFKKGTILSVKGHEDILKNLKPLNLNLDKIIKNSTLLRYISPLEVQPF